MNQPRETALSKTTFITGATGSIGGALARRLSSQGAKLRLLVRDVNRAADLKALPGVELVRGDISDPSSLRGVLDGCGIVYHSAAKLQGSNVAEYTRVNVDGTAALAEEAARANVDRFVHVSSIAVYGYPPDQNITEDHVWVENRAAYVITKRGAEMAIRKIAEKTGLAFVFARPGDVYGPDQSTWTVQFAELLGKGILQPPTRSTSGMLNLIYIDNLVDALLLMGEHTAAVGQAFNVIDRQQLAHDYIQALGQVVKHPLPLIPVPGWVLYSVASLLEFVGKFGGRESHISADNTAFLLHKATISSETLRTRLGWSSRVSAEEAERCTAEWLRSKGFGK